MTDTENPQEGQPFAGGHLNRYDEIRRMIESDELSQSEALEIVKVDLMRIQDEVNKLLTLLNRPKRKG